MRRISDMTLGSTRGRSVGPFTIGTSRAPPEPCLLLQCGGRGRKCRVSGGGRRGRAVAVRRAARRRRATTTTIALFPWPPRAANERAVPHRVWCKVRGTDGRTGRGKAERDNRLQKGGEGNGGRTGYRMSTFCPICRRFARSKPCAT